MPPFVGFVSIAAEKIQPDLFFFCASRGSICDFSVFRAKALDIKADMKIAFAATNFF